MDKRLGAVVAGAAIVGSGLAGFGLTSAFAQTEETPAEPPAAEGERPEGCHGHRGAGLAVIAEAIGIEQDELRAALEDGSTPAEVAEANDVDRDTVFDALVEHMNERIDQAVEDERLTEDEADEKRAEVEDRANAILDGERPERPEGAPQGPGADDDAEDSEDAPEEQESSFNA